MAPMGSRRPPISGLVSPRFTPPCARPEPIPMRIALPCLCLAAALALTPPVAAQGAPPGAPQEAQAILSDAARLLPVIARHGMVASQEAKATRIGVEVLQKGGNAVDAAVCAGFF